MHTRIGNYLKINKHNLSYLAKLTVYSDISYNDNFQICQIMRSLTLAHKTLHYSQPAARNQNKESMSGFKKVKLMMGTKKRNIG